MRKDGCCAVQLGNIMNEVDRGWRRPSLTRNGSQQRDVDIDPSVTFPPFPSFLLSQIETLRSVSKSAHTDTHCGVHIKQCQRTTSP